MSQILISIGRGKLQFQLINVLAQIGITYFLCFLIMKLKFRWQAIVAALLLIGHWALFVAFPGTEGPFMSKTTNIGAVIDIYLFGHINPGYWANINFITSTVTTLFGVWTGQLLQSRRSHEREDAHPGDLCRCLAGLGPGDPPVEPHHQEDLHHLVHPLQHRLGAADAAGVLSGPWK